MDHRDFSHFFPHTIFFMWLHTGCPTLFSMLFTDPLTCFIWARVVCTNNWLSRCKINEDATGSQFSFERTSDFEQSSRCVKIVPFDTPRCFKFRSTGAKMTQTGIQEDVLLVPDFAPVCVSVCARSSINLRPWGRCTRAIQEVCGYAWGGGKFCQPDIQKWVCKYN